MKSMTTKEIIFDSKNLPVDISEVEWVLKKECDGAFESLIAENHRLVDTAKALQKLIVDIQPAMEDARKLMYAKVFSGKGTIEFREGNSVSFVQIEVLMAEWLKKYGGEK